MVIHVNGLIAQIQEKVQTSTLEESSRLDDDPSK